MDDQGAGSGLAGGYRFGGSVEVSAQPGHLQALEWFHNGRSLRVQVNAQARWRNASTRSARRS
jgi:hypothetical protein